MNYYITSDNKILTKITEIAPDPPQTNQRVAFGSESLISGKEVCVVSEAGTLYFVLQESINLVGGRHRMTGIVTEAGQGDPEKVKASIKAYLDHEQ